LLRAQLDKARLVTQEVFIAAPIYQEVAVTLWVGVIPADADRVRANVTLAMYRFFHPLWGGTDGAGWPFGEDIYPSAVMKCAQEALGAGLVVTRVLISQPDGPATQCEPLAIGPLTLPNLKRVQLRFKPMPTTEGGLT
jgi:hypothetical protein